VSGLSSGRTCLWLSVYPGSLSIVSTEPAGDGWPCDCISRSRIHLRPAAAGD